MALAFTDTSSSAQSKAFQTGLQHGKVLAQTHAAQGKKVVAKPAATPDAETQLLQLLTQNVGQTPTQLSTQANTLAHNDVAAQVAAYQQQQQAAKNLALQQAQQINLASQAAAKYESGLGDQTAASFDNAAKSEAGFAQGYSGQLAQTASDAAAKVQAGLNAVGAPAGQAPSTTQGTDLANVLHGLGGQIPANTLESAGQAAAAAQRLLPAATLGYGQQQASGVLGQGAQAAAALTPQITNAQNQLPTLAAQYLTQLGTQNNDAVTQRNNEIELASLIQNRTATQATAATKAGAPKTFGSASAGYYSIDPASGKVTQVTPPVVKPTTLKTFGGSKTGYYTLAPDGTVTQITPPVVTPPKATKVTGGLTESKVSSLIQGWSTGKDERVPALDANGKQIVNKLGVPQFAITPGQGTLTYPQQIQALIGLGKTPAAARAAVNGFVKPGDLGRPYPAAQANAIALSNAKAAYAKGISLDQALTIAKQKSGGSISDAVIDKTFAKVYYGSRFSPIPGSPNFTPASK